MSKTKRRCNSSFRKKATATGIHMKSHSQKHEKEREKKMNFSGFHKCIYCVKTMSKLDEHATFFPKETLCYMHSHEFSLIEVLKRKKEEKREFSGPH